ncbi:putative bifunctional diguanylate cyclase/phosphodiesterase [Mariprofundus ferrooxydans]|uniref:Uncharacterized protein n=1 Tax=Mariprofundus ferrooxydans PV-1 TaxID=314345 RepID=Q0EX38_9PROT|nr:bifunctional diguanylate cyclase/phosphodiesterase [Mariprofundus ferrooxydans]EAU53836.1 Hypothetical protein yddU [Mariprofundus ferrooxydans PV-1]KON47337.1 hypothetical protein AL013_08785 [Mariprofundus ferrooxydans]
MTTEHIADLCVQEQTQDIIVYHKIVHLAQQLGMPEQRAEQLAASVSIHNRQHPAASIACDIESGPDGYRLVISSGTWRELASLPAAPDAALIREEQASLPDMSLSTLLQLMQTRHDDLQRQRNSLIQEVDRLSAKLQHNCREMEYQSRHDTLTGLANRPMLAERAMHAFQIARRQAFKCCLVLMDLKKFKQINDALGQQVGDLLLQAVASRFKQAVRSSDTLARVGGNEFAVLLLNNDIEQAEIVAEKLHHALNPSFEMQGHILNIDVSIGIAEFPTHGEDIADLMQRANAAMHHAKNNKMDTMVYQSLLDEHSLERLSLFNELNEAITTGTLELYYQPQVVTHGEGIPSLEALIRWPHPVKGMVFPDRFIPMAEDSGLIIPMTWWVLESAMEQCAAWHRAGLPVTVAVNFSAHCLQEDDIVQRIADCIKRHNLPDHSLVLEITESMIMADPHQASTVLLEIDKLKVDVSIDDFGTGHSSLAYLKHLLVDELKIDRSFVMGMHEHKNDEVIVRTVISMAHNMGLRVVAEGVETRRDWDALTAMNCDRIQGYFISRPLPVEQITRWLEAFVRDGLQPDE